MADQTEERALPADRLGRVLYSISRVLALFGALVLCGLAALTATSVFLRNLPFYQKPIPGDVELTAIGIGVAVFALLPYCQMVRGNVLVDFFMSGALIRAKAFCDMVANIIYTVIAAILTWRLIFGAFDMYRYSEKSMTINFPIWSTFPISIVFMAFLVIVTIYTVARSFTEMRKGEFLDPQ